MIRQCRTDELTNHELARIRELLWAAFADDEHGAFEEDDWDHALGGTHFLAEVKGEIVCHASVVERTIEVSAQPMRTGYVEAVATDPAQQRRRYGTAVMRAVNEWIGARFELGMLGTGSQAFYERLGWRVWQGPSSVRTADGAQRTPEEDGYIMYLRTPTTPPGVDDTSPISCEWRTGDVW
ncbi:MAG TPA: GNAT family N-acetyltransferase [Aeromicrobium sp.]|nr:GNAT family N-acetyltransferase [Aeromicrobium sp.]